MIISFELDPKKAPQTVEQSGEARGVVISIESNTKKQLDSALTRRKNWSC